MAELFLPVEKNLPSGTFSPLARATAAAPQDRATGDQWANYFVNRNAIVDSQPFPVRPEELRMTGIGDLLVANPRETYSRADLLARQADAAPRAYPKHGALRGEDAQYSEYVSPGRSSRYAEELTHIPGIGYEAPHFDNLASEDLISHSRVSSRQLPLGRAVHVDEIQSDLHQAARDAGGYRTPDAVRQAQELEDRAEELRKKIYGDVVRMVRIPGGDLRVSDDVAERFKRHPDYPAYAEMRDQAGKYDDFPPLAPYAKTYHEQEFNKALRRAAREDADAVTWTTGRQQASRWGDDLQNFTDLQYDPASRSLRASGEITQGVDRDGKLVFDMGGSELRTLPSLFGNELAQRLQRGETIPEGWVGGGGMRDFYDGALSKYARSFANRFPGSKVEDVDFNPSKGGAKVSMNRQMLLDNMRANNINVQPFSQGMRDFWPMAERFAAGDRDENLLSDAIHLGFGEQSNLTPSALANMIDNNLYAVKRDSKATLYDKVHGLTLSPEARAWIKRNGLPIASASPLAVMAAQGEE